MRIRSHLLGCVASLTLFHAPASAEAVAQATANGASPDLQEQAGVETTLADQAVPKPGPTTSIGDIVVTARRRSESIQTVPVAVSVATAQTLEEHQVLNTYQLVNLTPSLQVQSSNQQKGAVNFTIRGVGTVPLGPQTEQDVSVVIDDVAMSRPQLGNVQFFDLDRVEVLRGPQGMLFGKNAVAGLINIVTAQPKLGKTEVLGNALYGNSTAPGNGNTASLQLASNLPIGSTAALRISAFVTRQDEFVQDVRLHQDLGNTSYGGRAKVLWEPTAGVRLTLAGDVQRSKGPGEGVLVRRFNAPGGLIEGIDASNGIVASPTNNRMATDVRNYVESTVYGGQLKAEVDLGGGYTLTNIIARRWFDQTNTIDTDTTTLDLFNLNSGGNEFRQTTEELRLASDQSGRFSFQAGLFYLDLNARNYLLQGANLGLPIPAGRTLLGGFQDNVARNKSYAVFSEGQYKVTERLRVTAGGRFTHDDLSLVQDRNAGLGSVPLLPTGKDFLKTRQDNLSYRFGLDFQITPDVLTYGTYSKGYKGPTFDQTTNARVAPEIPKSVELGIKSTLLDRRLRLNLALFDTTYDGFQTVAQAKGSAAGFITLNAGQLKTRGVELEFTAVPSQGLTISGGTTYNDTEYKNLSGVPCYYGQPTGVSGTNVCLPDGTTDVSGNQLANAPRWTTSITTRYEQPVSANWVGFVQADVYHRSSFFFNQTRDPRVFVGNTAIVGLSAGASTADGRVSLTAFVRNLGDKRVPGFILADPVAGVYVGPAGVPDSALGGDYWHSFGPNSYRTIGLSLNFKM